MNLGNLRKHRGHHLYPDVVRNHVLLNQHPNETEVCVAGCRVGNLDLLEAAFNEGLEEKGLLWNRHGVREGLVSISQVCGQPDWGL